MAELLWWWRKPAMISVKKIDGRTGGKTGVLIVEKIGVKIGNWTDERIEGKIVSSTGARTDKPIAARITGQTRVANCVGSIEQIMSRGNMVVKAERMPA